MRIKNQQPEKLVEGQKREVKRFAFLPTSVDDDYIVWLEFYGEVQVVVKTLVAVPDGIGPYGVWLAYHHEWVLKWQAQSKHCL